MTDQFTLDNLGQRKEDHINLASSSQFSPSLAKELSALFNYEPLFATTPNVSKKSCHFEREHFSRYNPGLEKEIFAKKCTLPLWVSSMTGGTAKSLPINQILAKASNHFGLGMGLGSCRPLLEEHLNKNISFDKCQSFADFNLRTILKDDLPLVANLGIAQIEKLIEKFGVKLACQLIEQMLLALQADGLFIHINILQEFLQPEGDSIQVAPIVTLKKLLDFATFKIGIKEVGQGMGPKSLMHLVQLPLEVIEFAALGGTNFSKLEILRGGPGGLNPLAEVGHGATQMLDFMLSLKDNLGPKFICKHVIVSGGVRHFLEGQYYIKHLEKKGLVGFFGQAHCLLNFANQGDIFLMDYINNVAQGLAMAQRTLEI